MYGNLMMIFATHKKGFVSNFVMRFLAAFAAGYFLLYLDFPSFSLNHYLFGALTLLVPLLFFFLAYFSVYFAEEFYKIFLKDESDLKIMGVSMSAYKFQFEKMLQRYYTCLKVWFFIVLFFYVFPFGVKELPGILLVSMIIFSCVFTAVYIKIFEATLKAKFAVDFIKSNESINGFDYDTFYKEARAIVVKKLAEEES